MSALQWIYVALIGLTGIGVIMAIAAVGKTPRAKTTTDAAVAFVIAVVYVALYVFTIRAL